MGRDKARLPFRGGDLVGAVAGEVERAAGNVTLVGHSNLPGIADRYPGEGPLGGILTALHHTSTDWNLIVACDMPEVTAVFLAELVARAAQSRSDVLLPIDGDGRPQPLCAVYHRRALAVLEQHFSDGVRKVTAALAGLSVERLAVGELSLFQNVNTPEDWAAYGTK
jgi:molybdopterin-guanine dinucleotide biosynthesis protein A